MKVKKAKWLFVGLALAMVLSLLPAMVVANDVIGSIEWTGQGTDSMNCEDYEEGTMHWVLNQARNVENPELVLYDKEGNILEKDNDPRMTGPVYHFYTGYYDLDDLEATVYFDGELAVNRQGRITSQFVLSGYCPEPECNIRLLYIEENGTERQPLVFVPTDNDIGDDGDIEVNIANDFYLDAVLNNVTVGTWCVDSETLIFLNRSYDYQMFDPIADPNWYEGVVDGDREDHYSAINWRIICYIITEYKVDGKIYCSVADEEIDITKNGIQLAVWHFTNPGTEPTCPVGEDGDQVVCESGCAIISEVEGVFGI